MKTQRLKIFEPQIFPVNSKFYILSQDNVFDNRIRIGGLAIDETNITESSDDKPYLKLINVGQGIAKDIFIDISFGINYEAYFELLKKELEKIDSQIKVNLKVDSCWIEKRNKEGIEFIRNTIFESYIKKRIDYLLPIKDSQDILKIAIPDSVISAILYAVFIFQKRFNEGPSVLFEKLIDDLNINLNVKYKDNLNIDYTDNFKIVMEMPNIKYDSKHPGMVYCFSLNRENKYFA